MLCVLLCKFMNFLIDGVLEFGCSFAYSHRNLFGKNQKVNVSLERGQIDSIFRINYTIPWIEADDKRTQQSIMIQVISFCLAYLSSQRKHVLRNWFFNLSLIIHLEFKNSWNSGPW